MSKKGFTSPDKFRDEAKAQAEEFDRKSNLYSNWKPKKGETPNCVRILPAKDDASFHLKVGKHFIRHEDGWEVFTCNYETYGTACPACEERQRLIKTNKKDAAAEFKPQVRGVFNIIDRADEEAGVQRWESPASKVWRPVIEWFKGDTKFNNLVGTKKDPFEGRDLNIIFKPDEDPGAMYTVWPDETSKLGTPEQIEKWLEETEPLIAEVLYPPIDYDVASVLTFGSPQDRMEVKRILREAAPEEDVEEDVEEESETVEELKKQIADEQAKRKVAEARTAILEKKTPEEIAIEKSAEARAAKEEEDSVPEEVEKGTSTKKKTAKVKEDVSTPENITRKVAEIRAKHSRDK